MKRLLLFCLILPCFAAAQDCDPARYRVLMREAGEATFGKKPDYQLAVNKLLSAKTCQPDSEAVVNVQLVRVFEEVNRQRELAVRNEREATQQRRRAEEQTKVAQTEKEKAEAEARRIYANDLAFKSQAALKDGDRATAFRLAEMAYLYVDTNNYNVIQAFIESYYYNDDPDTSRRLPWSYTFKGHLSYSSRDFFFNKALYSKKKAIKSAHFSPDGKNIVTASDDYNAIVWDVKTGKDIFTLKGHTGSINYVAYSPDGNMIASSSSDSTVIIWDGRFYNEIKRLSGYTGKLNCLDFSPDGNNIVTGSSDNKIQIYNIETDKITLNMKMESPVTSVAFSPAGRLLAVLCSGVGVKIFNVIGQKEVILIPDKGHNFNCVKFSPDGKCLATAGMDKFAQIWDINTGQELMKFKGHSSFIWCVTFSPDGSKIATCSSDTKSKIWDAKSGEELFSLDVGSGYEEAIVWSVDFSPDGINVITGASENILKIWDVSCKGEAIEYKYYASWNQGITFSPDSKSIVAASFNNTAAIINAGNGQETLQLSGDEHGITCVSFSPNGEYVATGTYGGTVNVWDVAIGQIVTTLKIDSAGAVNSIAFSPDNKLLAAGCLNGKIAIWDIPSNFNKRIIKEFDTKIWNICFNTNSLQIVYSTSEWGDTAYIMDLEDEYKITPFSYNIGLSTFINDIDLSCDGEIIAASGDAIRIWSIKNKKLIYTIDEPAKTIDFFPNGNWFATSSGNKIKIWDTKTGRLILNKLANEKTIQSLSISKDGSMIASGSTDNKIRIWCLSPDIIMSVKNRKDKFVSFLSAAQLSDYNLEPLLNIHPDNEQKLLATHETQQIAAFADLYAQNISQTGFPKKADYDRATRLYQACLDSGVDNEYFKKRIEGLKRVWEEKMGK